MQTLQNECGLQGAEYAKFCADLSDGLHAMGQPLTILRSALAMLMLPQVSEERRRYCLETASAQIERMCRLFGDMSSLAAVPLSEAERSSFRIWDLLAPLIEAHNSLLNEPAIEIKAPEGVLRATIRGDAERTEQALSAVVSVATSHRSPGDAIELDAHLDGDFIRVVFRNTGSRDRRVQSADRLRLALAEAYLRSQQGEYEFTEDPFCVSLSLPLCRAEADAMLHIEGLGETQLRQCVSLRADATLT